jgi:predicted small secreted protein
LIVVLVLLGAFVLPACNTVSGAGRDIRCLGKSMENCAEDSK